MPRPSISTVLFDLDDTLSEYNQDGEAVLGEAFAATGVGRFCSEDELWTCADDVGSAEDDHDFLRRVFRIAADRHGGPVEAADSLARTYEAAVDHSDVSFRPGAERALSHARDLGPVGLVTNGTRRTQEVKLDALGIDDAFGTLVYAGDDTAPKPSRKPFDDALSSLGTTPEESLYVGNSLKHDVAGAQGAGMRAAWYPSERDRRPSPDPAPDHTFETLRDLEPVLD